MQLKYFVILLSIISIALCYYLAGLSQPVGIEISEVSQYEDRQVIVEGVVTEHHLTSYGGHIIDICSLNESQIHEELTIFVEEPTTVEYGDRIKAVGVVQKYKDSWEIVADTEKAVTITKKWENISTPLWQLAENPTRYEGMNVKVTGLIDRKYETYFYLEDTEGEHTAVVYVDPTISRNFSEGEEVSIGAQFEYDPATFRYVLMVKDETHTIAEVF